jgi:hypothetical protein
MSTIQILDALNATQTVELPNSNGRAAATASRPVVLSNEDFKALTSGRGITAAANFTPTATAYSAGNIMDVAQQFSFTYSDGSTIPIGSLIRILTVILKIDTTALQTSEAAYTLQNYSITPPSALADNGAWTLASADLSSYRGAINLNVPVDLGAALYVKTPLVDLDIKLTGTSFYGQLQTIAGFTPTAIARQVLLYGIVL